MRAVHRLALVAATGIFFAGFSQAGTVTYSTRVDFNTAFPGLPIEDFEAAVVGSGSVEQFGAPLSSATNNAIFAAGSILPGLELTDAPGPDATGLLAFGAGHLPGGTKSVGSNTYADSLNLIFSPGVYAVGFDLTHAVTPREPVNGTITIEVYGPGGLLAAYTPSIEGFAFFGVSSDADAIVHINLRSVVGTLDGIEVVDNVAFGAASSEVPEPATALLTAAGGLALLALRKRMAR